MPLQVSCPHCTTACVVPDELVGVPVQCGSCQRSFSVRSPLADSGPRPAPPPPPRLDLGGHTSVGRVRKENEDHFTAHHLTWSDGARRHEAALIVVADGLGGHDAGAAASAAVGAAVGAALLPLLGPREPPLSPAQLADALAAALRGVNATLHNRAKAEKRVRGMGATAAVVAFRDGRALIGHVGDARVYHLGGGQWTQVTRDQTVAARMVELGKLTPREARTHPARHEVLQAIGHSSDLKMAQYDVRLAVGDVLVVASDGLHARLDNEDIRKVLGDADGAADALARRLVEAADAAGGDDNCSVVVLRAAPGGAR